MKLHKYLTEKAICLDLNGRKKDEAITELAELLADHPNVKDSKGFIRAVFAREKDSTTGIGHGIAIPHARTDCVGDFVAAVGLSKSGIDFNAIDGNPVKLVILMGIPAHKVNAYLKLLAHLSLLLRQDGFEEALLSAPDAKAVVEAFAKYEE